jgi:phospholipase/carboxylesterase
VTLSGPILAPASGGLPKQLVVLIHGYGADGEDLIGLGQHWRETFPDALFAAPNAPTRCAQNPFGYEWFPIAFEAMIESVRIGVPAASETVALYLDDLWSRTGLGAADTFLVGFSQGAMLALRVGLTLPDTLRGVVSFSGALVPPALPSAKPPVCLIHGQVDEVVDPRLTADASAWLETRGYDTRVHISPAMAHGIAPDGLDFATRFMLERLAPATG